MKCAVLAALPFFAVVSGLPALAADGSEGDRQFFRSVEGEWVGPGEIVAGKYKGKPSTSHTITVSADGKTRTSTAKGTDKTGKPIDSVSYYEKQ